MRFIPIERVKPGMVLAQSIYDDADFVLLGAYMELTKEYIKKLTERGYPGVYIEYSDEIEHLFRKFRAPFSGKAVHTFPELSAVI